MPMRLVKHSRKILFKAWSIRLILLGGIFTGLAAATPFFDAFTNDPKHLFAIVAIINAGAFVARFIPQKGFDDDETA